MSEIFPLIRAAIWGNSIPKEQITDDVFHELDMHSLLPLEAPILSSLNMSDSLRGTWKNQILKHMAIQVNYLFIQETLPVDVPYVILKGTSAAQYYPYPEFRSLGDIDIMTRHEDYEIACMSLLKSGYKEIHEEAEKEFGRHRVFTNNGAVIEVHAFFSLLNDPKQAQYLDSLIINGINPSHKLPDIINGLTLLEHISQHLEEGLGLRQIIDWMMFVDKCLADEKWREFFLLAEKIGLDKLAFVVTRMCEKYLGLMPHEWCNTANEEICDSLLDYVMACGDFGVKRVYDDGPGATLLTYGRTPVTFFRLLQERGLVNWRKAQRNKILRPFAWAYQICRYLKNGLGRDNATAKLKKEVYDAKLRMKLFDALGVKQTSKGLSKYENGEYIKTYQRP